MSVCTETFQGAAADWDRFVASMPCAAGYYSHAWRAILERSFGHETHFLAARTNDVMTGVLPLVHMRSIFGNFLVSLPFVTYGGLLCRDQASSEALLDAAEDLRSRLGAHHVELRHTLAVNPDLPARRHKVAMVLALAQSEEEMWTGFNAKVRNQVRKAQKAGLETVWGEEELLDEFYAVFVRNMRDLGTPVYARSFFANILAGLPGATRIVLIRRQGQPIAAGLLYWHGETLEIPWASSIRDYNSLCPNNLMYWESIRHALRLGLRRFDLGRSSLGSGTFRFKEQWGARPEILQWHYLLPSGAKLPNLSNSNPKFSMAIRLWQRLPLAMTRALGPLIVRDIP
ncbi:FemAB family XrtA/PEP-CTERM system-associated protein [Desulfomicrobium baculatum]|uniref:FemAB-related protein, PEP-CTERM system-associated n=1 Tax=Desulfomicrobium baculatum (strain DSM 4028 / VKM B-1378 / X) TaxID=525897 RepID=C7LPR9_DESBD|nr:FemAB family XrtA/PEP-CTERM system-associated protein [Desulfomicrobium baculatum]ACU90298.1 FemAB-related protein, PEP-CTERM system- associated [Desulfomicrobium baculatum DSM 4028]